MMGKLIRRDLDYFPAQYMCALARWYRVYHCHPWIRTDWSASFVSMCLLEFSLGDQTYSHSPETCTTG